jgi:hypothetical protein
LKPASEWSDKSARVIIDPFGFTSGQACPNDNGFFDASLAALSEAINFIVPVGTVRKHSGGSSLRYRHRTTGHILQGTKEGKPS